MNRSAAKWLYYLGFAIYIGAFIYVIDTVGLRGWKLIAALVILPALFGIWQARTIILPSIYQIETIVWGKPLHTFKKKTVRHMKIKPRWGDKKE